MIQDVIDSVLKDYSALSHKDGALNVCYQLSCEFERRCIRAGIKSELLGCFMYRGPKPKTAHRQWLRMRKEDWGHYVTIVDGKAYDFTIRQFRNDTQVPLILPLEEYKKLWYKFCTDDDMHILVD